MELAITDSPLVVFEFITMFVIIPITILFVGAILFYYKPKHRMVIGASLIIFGIIELAYGSFVPHFSTGLSYLIIVITIILGIISVFYSLSRVTKN
jgi:hypothetical protein